MQFPLPSSNTFTIYSKSGCLYCHKVKQLLDDYYKSYTTINCDEYLVDDREQFLSFLKEKSGKECKTFPIVFHNEKYIGGYMDTVEYLNSFFV